MALSQDRIDVLNRIKEYEQKEMWDVDVENDPPSKVILPNQVDYLNKKLTSKIANLISNKLAIKFFDGEIKKGNLIIKKIIGLEHFKNLTSGAIITCNHFNVYDNYIVFKAFQKTLGKKHLYKIIREGNYTSMKGLFGFFFRHCNTLPLSSNRDTMKEFLKATKTLLERGEKILVYPEQAMWWNYKKPRPFKNGAFKIAATNNVPILPCFITMKDSNKVAPDGSYYQEYTMHIKPPIYPNSEKNIKENTQELMQKNYDIWKDIYEEVYKEKLVY